MIRSNELKVKRVSRCLLFFMVTGLVWFHDDSLIDSDVLPKILSFSILICLFVVLLIFSYENWIQASQHLNVWIAILAIPFSIDLLKQQNVYGESQRINGSLSLIIVAGSIIVGTQIRFLKITRALYLSIVSNGLVVSFIIILSNFLSLQRSPFELLINSGVNGGINENFKSLFLGISIALHSILVASVKALKWRLCLLTSASIHLIALIILESLQSFALLFIFWSIIFLMRRLSRLVPLVPILFIALYFSTFFSATLYSLLDNSNRERIDLAKKAFEMLQSAPLISPDSLRISEFDLGIYSVQNSNQTNYWVNDVHNYFLNTANTIGILFSVAILFAFGLLVKGYFQNAQTLSLESKNLGALIIATFLILNVTVVHPIYFYFFCILIGVYLSNQGGLQAKRITWWSQKCLSPFRQRSTVNRNLKLVIHFFFVLQLFLTSFFLIREYSIQESQQLSTLLRATTAQAPLSESQFSSNLDLMRKSSDLRFIYEVGRRFYLNGECTRAREAFQVLQKASNVHFLTRKLDALIDECQSVAG